MAVNFFAYLFFFPESDLVCLATTSRGNFTSKTTVTLKYYLYNEMSNKKPIVDFKNAIK